MRVHGTLPGETLDRTYEFGGFRLTLFDTSALGARTMTCEGRYTYNRGDREASETLQAKVCSGFYVGPWCSRCGKRGKNCRDRAKCGGRRLMACKAPVGTALGVYHRGSREDAQKRAYEANVGRSWDDVEQSPRPQDFGAPEPPEYPQRSDDYEWRRPTRAEKARATRAHADAVREYQPKFAAYSEAMDEWRSSERHARYQAACEAALARAAQFRYTGGGKDAPNVLAAATVEDEVLLAVAA